MAPISAATAFRPVAAETGKELQLAMQSLFLAGRILPVGARLTVRHIFECKEKKPLEVIYAFALPRDAALRRFHVTGPGFSVRSELKPVAEAVELYEAGVERGHLATLARQYRDGVVNLTLGNLRPGETVTVTLQILAGVETRDDGLRFRFPFTLAPSYHAHAKAVLMADGMGEMELPEDEFGDVILPRYTADASKLHQVGFDLSLCMPGEIKEVASPSHPVRVLREDGWHGRVALASAADLPDRDLVLDVRASETFCGTLAGLGADGKGYFAGIAASTAFGGAPRKGRRVALVLDRSGSMGGVPIEQARKAMEACLTALAEGDLFGIVAFDDKVENFRPGLVAATQANRDAAREFLRGIDARGGTELAAAVLTAAKMLGSDGGDILVVTDGQVFGTETILEQARAAGLRMHCLGIGSASQDRFLALLARETGGVSRFVTPRERVDIPAVDLFASIARPVAEQIEVKVDGFAHAAVSPDPQTTVFGGSPLVVFGETGNAGEGKLRLSWQSTEGSRDMEMPLAVGKNGLGEVIRLIRGARLLTDLESRLEEVEAPGAAGRRTEKRIGARLEALSQSLGLASRRMALVAVVERAGDQPGDIPQTHIVPVGMPQDTLMSGVFNGALDLPMLRMAKPRAVTSTGAFVSAMSTIHFPTAELDEGCAAFYKPPAPPPGGPDDLLLELAGRMQSDGGMPGRNEDERTLATLLALLCFSAEGHTPTAGAFRRHVQRLISFLELRVSDPLMGETLERIKRGEIPAGDWPVPPDTARLRELLERATAPRV